MKADIKEYLKLHNVAGTKRYDTLEATLIASYYHMVIYKNAVYINGEKMMKFDKP